MTDSRDPTPDPTAAAVAAAPGTRRSQPLKLLGERDYRLVWMAGASMGVVRWLDTLAVAVYFLQVTGSALLVSLTIFLRMGPMFVLGAYGGAFAETVNRRKLLMGLGVMLGAVYAILAALAFAGVMELWQLGLGVVLSGVFWSIEFPVRRTMVGEIAGVDRVGPAMGLESSTNNFTRMLGPLAGGVFLEFFGIEGALALEAALYGVGAALLLGVNYGAVGARGERPSILNSIIEGLVYIRGNRAVAAVVLITIIVTVFGFSFVSMVPVIAKQELGLSPFPTGILASAEGCGAFVGSLLIAFFAHPRRFQQIFFGGSMLYLLCILLFARSSLFAVSLPVLWLGGFGVSGFAAMQAGLIIANAPTEIRNRLMGVVAMCIGIGPFAALFLGYLADRLGAATGVTITSATGIVVMLVCALAWPELRRARDG